MQPRELVVIGEVQQVSFAFLQRLRRVVECGHDRAQLGVRRVRELQVRLTRGEPAKGALQGGQRRERAFQKPPAAGPRNAEQREQHRAREREPRQERALVAREIEIHAHETKQARRGLGGLQIEIEQPVAGQRLCPYGAEQPVTLRAGGVLREHVRTSCAGKRRELGYALRIEWLSDRFRRPRFFQ